MPSFPPTPAVPPFRGVPTTPRLRPGLLRHRQRQQQRATVWQPGVLNSPGGHVLQRMQEHQEPHPLLHPPANQFQVPEPVQGDRTTENHQPEEKRPKRAGPGAALG